MQSSALRKEVLSAGKHSLIYVIGQAISRAVGFLMIPVYTSYIAPSNYGAMELIEIITATCLMVISMGVGDGMSRFYYAEKDEADRKRVISTVILGFGIIGIPIVLVLLAIAPWICLGILEDRQYILGLQVSIACAWFGMLCEAGFTYLRMRYQAKQFVIITTLQLVAALSLNIYFIVFLGLGILGIFYSTLITQAVTGLLLAGLILRGTGVYISIPLLKRLAAFGLPLVPPQIGLMLGFSSNRFFLRWFTSPDPAAALALVGVFSLGHKFGLIVNRFINVPFNSFWGPRRLELLLHDEAHAKETVARMCTYATAVSVFFALLVTANIAPVVALAVGPGYESCAVVVPFVALAYIAMAVESHFKTGILLKRKTIWDTWISVVALAVILLWNYLFVPRFGLVGAATSNLAGFVVRLGLIYYVSQRLYAIPFELGRLGVLLVTAAGWYGVSQFFTYSSPWLTLCVRTGFVLLFPAVLFCCRFFRAGELEFVTQLFSRTQRTPEKACVQA
ncbi:MAG TPA: oligosaccharide flippase family protein [Gemmataceae bacterium]|jgi:O-antigen/teichoic acid export membrane protein|nr:oligosaccharide flippase family protein [Gemmataceae bacterium]